MLRCHQAAPSAAVAYVLFVVVVVVSIAIAAAAFSWLLIVGSAPAIAVAAGVFVATVVARGGSAAPAALLPPLTLQCRQTSAAERPKEWELIPEYWLNMCVYVRVSVPLQITLGFYLVSCKWVDSLVLLENLTISYNPTSMGDVSCPAFEFI